MIPTITNVVCMALAGQAVPERSAQPPFVPPRLAVLIVVDQMRGDYPDRFAANYGSGGFTRLMRDGAHFTNAHYTHGTTATGPGHACIATGTNPRVHGIAANADIHGECDDDADFPLIGIGDPTREAVGASPRKLLAATLGDVLKLETAGHAHVVSVGLKGRAVVLMAGHAADRAVWGDSRTGRFITSQWFKRPSAAGSENGQKVSASLPDWADAMNTMRYFDQFFGKAWDRVRPVVAYSSCGPDNDIAELDDFGLGRTFPHPLNGGEKEPGPRFYKALWYTPFGNEAVFELARRAIDAESLGADDVPDLLCVALSSYDYCGHFYGSRSHELLDMTIRLDRQLADFLSLLDKRVGPGRFTVALTADHGVTPIAAHTKEMRCDAGTIVEGAWSVRLNKALCAALEIKDESIKPIAMIELPWVHLDAAAIKRAGQKTERVRDLAIAEIRALDGVGWVYAADQLANPLPAKTDEFQRMAREAYHPQTAGDIYVGLKPYWHKAGPDQVASHGSFHGYDRHVPIMLVGAGIKPGRYSGAADPIDIARTLCLMLGIEPAPTMSGRVLNEALLERP